MDNVESIFSKDLKGQTGSLLISDFLEGHKVIILGKSNVAKRSNSFESFGGRYEKEDATTLHTAVRETIEEFFNLKPSNNKVNEIAEGFRKNKLIIRQYELHGMSYLINFSGLNFIFQKLLSDFTELKPYDDKSKFNVTKYIEERQVPDKPTEGLNEIHSLRVFKINDIKEKKIDIDIRWYTNKLISKLLFRGG